MSVAVKAMAEDPDIAWSDYQKGLILSSFYWGCVKFLTMICYDLIFRFDISRYAFGMIPAAKVAQKYGAKYMFGLR